MIIKTTNLKMQCLLCGWSRDMELSAILIGDAQVYEVPDRYCANCYTLLEQIIDRVAEKE